MKWFAVYTLATFFWGNGAIEERSPYLEGFFVGTAAECEAFAASALRERAAAPRTFNRSSRHAIQPAEYHGGIVKVDYTASGCFAFDSADAIARAYPHSVDGMPTLRLQDGEPVPCWSRRQYVDIELEDYTGIVLCETGVPLNELDRADENARLRLQPD